jgi:hypothetical protein
MWLNRWAFGLDFWRPTPKGLRQAGYRRSRFQRVGTYECYRIAVASCVY